jgi:hypothetical protein
MKINFDPKTWLILVVSAIAIFLLFFYFYDSSGHKRLIKNLEQRADELEEKRDQLKQEVEFYKLEAKQDSIEAAKYQFKIDSINKVIALKDIQIQILRGDLQVQKDKKKETEKRIENLTKNPIKREGDLLIESLKEKTTKK